MIIFELIWNLSFLLLVTGQLSDEKAGNIFKELDEIGKIKVRTEREKQYVVLSGASENEIDEITKIRERAKTFLNNGRENHGEIMILDDGEITKLISDFKQHNSVFFVFLFSTYIPCSGIPKLQFSCAEELAAFMSQMYPTDKLIVAYREDFGRTDVQKALHHLSNGGITLYKLDGNNDKYRPCTLPRKLIFRPVIFQNEFSECLSELVNFDEGIPALVNGLVAQCLEKIDLLTGGRRLTFRSRQQMVIDLPERSTDFIRKKDYQTKRACEYCIIKSLDSSNSIGKPRDAKLQCDSWKSDGRGDQESLYDGKYELSGVITSKRSKIHKKDFRKLELTSSSTFISSNVARVLLKWEDCPTKWQEKRPIEDSSRDRSRKRLGSPLQDQYKARTKQRSRSKPY